MDLLAERGGALGIIFWHYIRKPGQQTAADAIRHIDDVIDFAQ